MSAPTVETVPAFDASVYDLPIPVVDGLKAGKLPVVFTGSLNLDRTNLEELALADLGGYAELVVRVVCTGKSAAFRFDQDGPGEMSYQTKLRVVGIVGKR